MNPSIKAWIDNASYEELLSKWRFTSLGDSLFQGESGAYFRNKMTEKRDATFDGGVSASKSVGWEKP